MMQSLNNERAKFAFDAVQTVVKEHIGTATPKKYHTLIRSLPAMIQMQGLGTTVAFLYSKKGAEKAHEILYDSTGEWCKQQKLLKNTELAKEIVQLDTQAYRMVTEEVLQMLLWKKRFAEGMIEDVE